MKQSVCLGAACAAAILAAASGASAQTVQPVRSTLDLVVGRSNLTSGLPDGESVNLRGVWLLGGGDVAYGELLQERKFGRSGGVLAGAYTRVFSPDWYGTGTVAAGHGGPNWASWRFDGQISRKWLEDRRLVTSAALYHARFHDDGSPAFERRVFDDPAAGPDSPFRSVRSDRSDRGLRLSAAYYLKAPAVLEGGITLNRSEPGGVASRMPYLAATYGRPGWQYLSVRVASGTEAYQALGSSQQLVDFRSDTASLTWRRWVGPRWGFTAQAEAYRNPTYRRQTVAVGLFAQWP